MLINTEVYSTVAGGPLCTSRLQVMKPEVEKCIDRRMSYKLTLVPLWSVAVMVWLW